MERKFNVGDKVRLISDAQENTVMTVCGYTFDLEAVMPQNEMLKNTGQLQKMYEGFVTCDWRDKSDVPYRNNYKENELEKC